MTRLEITDRRICPDCKGRRFIGPYLCARCNGDGSVIVDASFRHFTRIVVAVAFVLMVLGASYLIVGRP